MPVGVRIDTCFFNQEPRILVKKITEIIIYLDGLIELFALNERSGCFKAEELLLIVQLIR